MRLVWTLLAASSLVACYRNVYAPRARRHQQGDGLYADVSCDKTHPEGCQEAARIACYDRGYDVLDRERPRRGEIFLEIRCR